MGRECCHAVINTLYSRGTQGALLSVWSGNEDPIVAPARGARAAAASWRLYARLATSRAS